MTDRKLDIVNRDVASNQDAIEYLEEVLEVARNDATVEGVIVIVERGGMITTGGSYSKNWLTRLGSIEVAKAQVLQDILDGD